MDKRHALCATLALLFLVAQAHTLRESPSSSSSREGCSVIGVSTSDTTVDAGDPAVDSRPRSADSEGSSSIHEESAEASYTALLPRVTESTLPPPSFSSESDDASQATASLVDDFHNAILEAATRFRASSDGSSSSLRTGITIESAVALRPDIERSTTTTTPVVYVFSSSSLPASASSSLSDDSSPSSSAAASVDDSSYSAGTVEPNEERTAVESTALELSTSSEQVRGAVTFSTSTTGTSTTSTAPSSEATSTDRTDGQDADGNADSPDVATSSSALSSPIFYACAVLGVAGLAGAGFTFRAKRQRDCHASSEASVMTPPIPRRAAWAPPSSQIRVIIDDHNFAIL